MKLNIANHASYCIKVLEDAGFEAYCVGGAVRDLLLGLTPSDYDIATNAYPEDIIPLFDKVLKTGIKHGTVTVVVDKFNIEITTYRTDGNYTDSRHPDSVTFVKSIENDLARRDFTINAMAYNDTSGLIDLYGGLDDLKKGVLRAVGNPEIRFKEDALRILRLFRFACRFGFEIDKESLSAAILQKDGLKSISVERIFTELKFALMSSFPNMLFEICNFGALEYLGINKQKHRINISNIDKDLVLRFYSLLYATDSKLDVLEIIKADNKLKDGVKMLHLAAQADLPCNKYETKKLLNVFDENIYLKGLHIKSKLLGEDTSIAARLFEEIIKNDEPYKISQLKINGTDIITLGITDKKVGEVLSYTLDAVLQDPSLNEKKKLLDLITKL